MSLRHGRSRIAWKPFYSVCYFAPRKNTAAILSPSQPADHFIKFPLRFKFIPNSAFHGHSSRTLLKKATNSFGHLNMTSTLKQLDSK